MTSKVRPAWASSSAPEREQDASAVDTAAPEEYATPEGQVRDQDADPELGQHEPENAPSGNQSRRVCTVAAADEPHPQVDHDHRSEDGACAASSFGKETMDSDAGKPSYPSPAGSALTRIKAAISSFVERISGKRQSVPGGGAAAAGSRAETPEEIERRITRSLRDTGVEGLCRLAFGSPKGGVGKSSMAYAVAGAIAYFTNLRVCLVDCDPDFGATRYMVPRPLDYSVLDLAGDADTLSRLADLRGYVSQNTHMGLDILLNPVEAARISDVPNLADAYERVDSVLSQFYDLVVFDLGSGFRDPAIRRLLELSDELVLVSDSEKIPNSQLPDALNYVEGLGIDLSRTTLCINHGRRPSEESEDTAELRKKHSERLRSITEVEYDPGLSRLLNDREFHPAGLALMTRLGVLTTAGVSLEGLRRDAYQRAREKVIALGSENGQRAKDSQNGGS